MTHGETKTILISAYDYIVSGLRYGFSRESLLQALEEAVPGKDSETQTETSPVHYFVPVSYAPLSPVSELRNEFGAGSVSVIFDGRPWQKHPSCAQMDETDGERVMLVKHFGKEMASEQAIAWGEEHGYRPATEKEAVAFARANPDLQRNFWIIALGSFALDDIHLCVTALRGDDSRRILGGHWFGDNLSANDGILFVRYG